MLGKLQQWVLNESVMRVSRRSCLGVALAPLIKLPRELLAVPLHFQVARCSQSGPTVKPDEWVLSHVAAAQSVLRPHGIALSATIGSFSPQRCDLLTRSDRDDVAHEVSFKDTVNVLVMNRIRDLDVLQYDLMGVHWRYGGPWESLKKRRWVFLTARAEPPVLAHELCHFFGLPHDPSGGNLMTPGPSSPAWRSKTPPAPFAPVLTERQSTTLRAGIASWKATSTFRTSDHPF